MDMTNFPHFTKTFLDTDGDVEEVCYGVATEDYVPPSDSDDPNQSSREPNFLCIGCERSFYTNDELGNHRGESHVVFRVLSDNDDDLKSSDESSGTNSVNHVAGGRPEIASIKEGKDDGLWSTFPKSDPADSVIGRSSAITTDSQDRSMTRWSRNHFQLVRATREAHELRIQSLRDRIERSDERADRWKITALACEGLQVAGIVGCLYMKNCPDSLNFCRCLVSTSSASSFHATAFHASPGSCYGSPGIGEESSWHHLWQAIVSVLSYAADGRLWVIIGAAAILVSLLKRCRRDYSRTLLHLPYENREQGRAPGPTPQHHHHNHNTACNATDYDRGRGHPGAESVIDNED